jgi:hypothetical protein
MTLVVSVGLAGLLWDRPEKVDAAVLSLVKRGYTSLVREVVPVDRREDLADARVLEVRREADKVRSRWLAGAEARAILKPLAATYKRHDSMATLAWDTLDRIGAVMISTLALELDGPTALAGGKIRVAGCAKPVPAHGFDEALFNWRSRNKQAQVAAALIGVARKLRLVVHSA